jgi:hypothetical protein
LLVLRHGTVRTAVFRSSLSDSGRLYSAETVWSRGIFLIFRF